MATIQQSTAPARERHRSVVGPVILIGLGALFLAQNTGMVNGSIWLNIWRFWPVLLILAGVEMVLGRAGWGGALTTGLIAVVAFTLIGWAAVVGTVPYWSSNGFTTSVAGPTVVDRVSEDLRGIQSATVDLRHNAGRLEIGALTDGSQRFVEGEISHPENTSVYRSFEGRDGQGTYRLRDANDKDFPFAGNAYYDAWSLRFAPNVPLDLQVQSGASELDLNLRQLRVTNLRIEAGASAVKVALPEAAGRTSANIKAGAAGVDVTVPEGVAARIQARGGLTGLNIDQGRFPRVGGYYTSPNYETATNRVDLFIDTGVSGVTVR